jgi:hypothetical protein
MTNILNSSMSQTRGKQTMEPNELALARMIMKLAEVAGRRSKPWDFDDCRATLRVDDVVYLSGADADIVKRVFDLLVATRFLYESRDAPGFYGRAKSTSQLFGNFLAKGWTQMASTLEDVVLARGGWARTTNRWGNWELHNGGLIETKETGEDSQASRITALGNAAYEILVACFPKEKPIAAAA